MVPANGLNTPEALISHNSLWPASLNIPRSIIVKARYFGRRCSTREVFYFILQDSITREDGTHQDSRSRLLLVVPSDRMRDRHRNIGGSI